MARTTRQQQQEGLLDVIAEAACPLTGARSDYDPLLEMIGDARFVLIGEASHGTHEFYAERAEITRRLIVEKGFAAVAVEADWPDAYRVNRYVQGIGGDGTAIEALGEFKRFPAWMWRNAEVLDFVGWLRDYNDLHRHGRDKVGFFGLDLYSLYGSIQAVIRYLDKVDPEAARQARYRYSCFDQFYEDPQNYGHAVNFGVSEDCQQQVIQQLQDLLRRSDHYVRQAGLVDGDEYFFAEQNARLVHNAEQYYREMYRGYVSSWNLRDQHMADTLEALAAYLDRRAGGSAARIVVWAHNSHLGDASATDVARRGELNVGQLVRARHGLQAVLIGLTTYSGTVTAAPAWDAPAERKQVRPALADSIEDVFHKVGLPRFMLLLRQPGPLREWLARPRLERAIGVIYRPQTERSSHYFHARVGEQFDAVLHFDETRAVEPFERTVQWETGDAPETYPFEV